MPPVHAWFLLPVAFSGFLAILSQTLTLKASFWRGWLFGFGYFLGGLYWLGNGPKTLGMWLAIPFAAVGLPLLLAFFPAFVAVLAFRFTGTPLARAFGFAAFWSAAEWLRGHIFTGLPWNLSGYAWDIKMLQVTSVIGIYGLSALSLLGACIFFTRHKGWIGGVILGLGALQLWGGYRLAQPQSLAAEPYTSHPPVNLRIVQASIPQQTKWLAEHFHANLERYLALSHLAGEKPLTAVIWPESSVPTVVENSPALLQRLAEAAPTGGTVIFGAPREVAGKLRTSMVAVNDQAKVVGTYDKAHLVPFGEYMPYRSWVSFKKLTYGETDYTPGAGIQTLMLPGLPPVSPLICYEAVFPHAVARKDHRPSWMLNLTNDAWFGHSSGPYQHLQIVRVRAIEEGMPLVRAANNGISAVIDAFGQIIYRLELDEIGFIDFTLPPCLAHATPYSRWGDLPFAGILVMLLFLAWIYRQPLKSKRPG